MPWAETMTGISVVHRKTAISTPSLISLPLFGLILLVLGVVALAGAPSPAGAAGPRPEQVNPPDGPLNFDACVYLALSNSPYLKKSSLEIEIRKLDESDSRYGMIPPLTFRTYYYVNQPKGPSGITPQPYSLSFSMDPYNPLGSYFTLQAQKKVTQIAILKHLKVIAAGLRNLGNMFLDLEALKTLLAYQTEMVNLARENLVFAENRLSIGTGTSVEVKMATRELELARGEEEHLRLQQERELKHLKTYLGLKTESINLDLRDARRQVLGNFNPATATYEQAKERSYDLKILQLQLEVQGYQVLLAKAKVFPDVLFNTQTPDPLSLTNNPRGMFVGFGLQLPVWDGFKRFREVTRQKAMLKQVDAEIETKKGDFVDLWENGKGEIQETESDLKLAQIQEELTQLKARQVEVQYNSGNVLLSAYLEARKGWLEAKKITVKKTLLYHMAILKQRQLSGDLSQTYVDQNSWQN
jgi:outer membrane protein TolC